MNEKIYSHTIPSTSMISKLLFINWGFLLRMSQDKWQNKSITINCKSKEYNWPSHVNFLRSLDLRLTYQSCANSSIEHFPDNHYSYIAISLIMHPRKNRKLHIAIGHDKYFEIMKGAFKVIVIFTHVMWFEWWFFNWIFIYCYLV